MPSIVQVIPILVIIFIVFYSLGSNGQYTATSTLTTVSTSYDTITISISQDYFLFVQPYLKQLEGIRAVLMQPYKVGGYGYDQAIGQVCGGNIEASPAINQKNGYTPGCVETDNNIEGGCALDYWNSNASVLNQTLGFKAVQTNICQSVRQDLSLSYFGIGGCSIPFKTFQYPSSFSLLDRREAEYGFTDPYAAILEQPGVHIGGIGASCGTQGQVYFAESSGQILSPSIIAEMPGAAIGIKADLEELSFLIDEYYMQCQAGTAPCSLWQTAYLNAMSQYPFPAPREALHFIQATRATEAWSLSNLTYSGMSALTMVQNTITHVFTKAVGNHGGLCQSFTGCAGNDQTPESNMQAMIAFLPQMPEWFVK